MDGFYTGQDFKKEALGIFNGTIPNPRKWSLGWKIYHLTSSECYSNSKQNMEEIDLEYDYLTKENYTLNRTKQLKTTMEGIIESIVFCSLGHSIEHGFEEVARVVAYEHLLLR